VSTYPFSVSSLRNSLVSPQSAHSQPLHPSFASDPTLWTRTFLNIIPDPLQTDVLEATEPKLLLNCTRQWGKTTIIAAKTLHFALFHPNTTTLVAAPSERQALILLRRLQTFFSRLSLKTAPVPSFPFSVLLPNGSEIIALPASADTTRGFTAHLLVFDEAARIPDRLFHALAPTRATTSGPVWLLSTPNGPAGFFYDIWEDADSGFRRFRVPASDCPRITQEFLAAERLILGDDMFRQEYHCEFIAGPHTLLSLEVLEAAIDPNLMPLFLEPLWS
jgi:hypothetical protein